MHISVVANTYYSSKNFQHRQKDILCASPSHWLVQYDSAAKQVPLEAT